MLRGEIYWADLNPVIGSEIAKIRPVLIVSNDLNNEYSSTVTILPITSSTAKVYPFEVRIMENDGGLRNESKAKANQIRTIDKRRLGAKLGQLSEIKMREIEQAILIHLDIF
ncbi:MAG: type II toxin-antitoxin system PemK/MazF family toxin [Dyadobacter sp.]|uniref:type II toxin-antitoxin system PemK/MazF family toxin n=1 Tax=Dyadobacter sp. TaxID=1914288 RepID=UPI0032659A8B